MYVGPDNHFAELNYLRSKYLALWLIFTLSRSYSKDADKAIGQSARSRDETLLDWSVRPRVYYSDSVTLCVPVWGCGKRRGGGIVKRVIL